MATARGTKEIVLSTTDPFTEKSAEVAQTRVKVLPRNHSFVPQRRQVMLRALLERWQKRGAQPSAPTHGKGLIVLDDYTIRLSNNLNGFFMDVDSSVKKSAEMTVGHTAAMSMIQNMSGPTIIV